MSTAIGVEVQKNGNVFVFRLQGELDETNADKTFDAVITTVGDFVNKKIVFNFLGLKYLNSKAIERLVNIFSRTEDAGGSMYICNLSPEVKDTLSIIGLTEVIHTVATEADALALIAA